MRDHWVQPLLFRSGGILAKASANASMLRFDDREDPKILSSLPGAASPGTAKLLCLRVDEDGDRGLPLRGLEAELLLHSLVVEGADHGVEVEVLGAIDGHRELSQRSHRCQILT